MMAGQRDDGSDSDTFVGTSGAHWTGRVTPAPASALDDTICITRGTVVERGSCWK